MPMGGLTAMQRAQREQVRFEAAELLAQGVTPPLVARRLRVSRKSAYAWHARWREGGVEALRSESLSGQPSRMKPGWRKWLATELGKGPAAHGWVEDQRWTPDRIATVIARHFHVRFSPAQTWRIPHRMGLTMQAPQRRAAERDEDAVVAWIKETWPRAETRGTCTPAGGVVGCARGVVEARSNRCVVRVRDDRARPSRDALCVRRLQPRPPALPSATDGVGALPQ
ncbi:winged helix-turn-helix domain-containing protein [Streptomyces sp. NPDC008086]|uniref:winged helix-turn-helix domain-containing protein n=1 Tax=Streptomyces sp. NPDC008086 TaxID=3364807 RepID=UPI0036E134E9